MNGTELKQIYSHTREEIGRVTGLAVERSHELFYVSVTKSKYGRD
jgi:hypothetical protein